MQNTEFSKVGRKQRFDDDEVEQIIENSINEYIRNSQKPERQRKAITKRARLNARIYRANQRTDGSEED